MVSLVFFTDISLPAALLLCGRLSHQQKWVRGILPGSLRRPVRMADNLTTSMCRLSWNMGASNSWNPQNLPRPVMGLPYLLPVLCILFFGWLYLVSWEQKKNLFLRNVDS